MKKILKKLSMLLPLVVFSACGTTQTALAEAPTPDAGNQINTYLVLGKNGLYENAAGQDVESLFIENAITYAGKPGDALPGEDKITSTVKDVKFISWLCYEDLGKPTVYDKVPNVEGKILYAFWQYTGTGEVVPPVPPTPPTPPEPPVEEKTWYVVGKGSFVNGTDWDLKSGVAMERNKNNTEKEEYMKLNLQLTKGDVFKIASSTGLWVEKFETGNGSSFASGTLELVDNGQGGKNAKVVKTGKFDLYLKDEGKNSSIWIQDSK